MSGRVLVVDDTATNRVILKAKLSAAYYTVILAESGEEGLARAEETEPDVVLLDVLMPGMDGYEVCRRLKAAPRLAHIPVIMVTALNSPEERLRGLECGADDFLTKPLSDLALLARLRNLVRMKVMFDELRLREATARESGFDLGVPSGAAFDPAGGHVLVVTGDRTTGEVWSGAIARSLAARVTAMTDSAEALDLLARDPPDAVVVTERTGAGEDGRRLVSAIRARQEARHAAILFAVESGRLDLAAQALDLGATDYFLAPVDPAELIARLRSQLRRKFVSDRLRTGLRDGLKLAMIDPLTGLFNRRYATHHLDSFVARARATGQPFAGLMLDLDRFKAVNDRHGHPAGDAVLRDFARRLRENVRGIDLVARLGGEEFFVAMPDVDLPAARQIAERIRTSIETPPFALPDGTALAVTVSIGVALCQPGDDAGEVIRRADRALYASKHGGRNRVTVAEAA